MGRGHGMVGGGDLFLIDLPVWLNLNDESSCDREWLGRLKSPFDQFNNVS